MKALSVALLVCVAGPCIAASPPQPVTPPPAQVLQTNYLYEIARHLYRWYLDESDLERLEGIESFPFWVCALEHELDPGDHSRYAEIVLPLLSTQVTVKHCDYRIEELGVQVSNQTFMIVNVARVPAPARPSPAYTVVEADLARMKADLLATRYDARFPDAALLKRMTEAVDRQLPDEAYTNDPDRTIVHLAPLSPVANETWVFWETGRMLIHFASDLDIANPAMWEHDTLTAELHHADEDMVVTHAEAPGSNAYLTRDQIGRVLYNCIVLAQRIEMDSESQSAP